MIGITIRTKIMFLLISMVLFLILISIVDSNTGGSNQLNITTQTITINGYTVIKLLIHKHAIHNIIQDIINYVLKYYYVLIAPIVALILIRYLKNRNSVIRIRMTVNTRILNNYEETSTPKSRENYYNNKEEYNNVYLLAKSLLKYPRDSILRLFRALCGSKMRIIILIEKYPSSNISNIMKVIKDGMLEKCIHLKYVGNAERVDLNIMNIDEIMSIIDRLSTGSDTEYNTNNVHHVSTINISKDNNKENDRIIVYGRRKKYIISKKLYEELRKGIDTKELRRKYDNNTYNLLMDMYSDGIIIFNGNKIILVE